MLKVHLGCGRRFIPGFVHVDIASFPHIDHNHDIRTLPMFEDGSVDLLYCCHAFEYFDRCEAADVLAEYYRVLKPGGVLRLAVPDFEALCTVYRQSADIDRVLGPLYGRMPIAVAGKGEQTIYHRTVYDRRSLTNLLTAAGYADVHPWDWRTTEHAAVDDYSRAYVPHMDSERGILISLNLQGARPSR